MNQRDEFENFRNVINFLKEKDKNSLANLINQLPNLKKEFLIHVLSSQRIKINENDVKTLPRKIVKVRGIKQIKE